MRLAVIPAFGLCTCALAVGLVYGFDSLGIFYLMSLQLGIFPAGAIGVGLVAASGFVAGMWLSGLRAGRDTYLTVGVLLAVTYFAAHYAEFLDLNPAFGIGFWRYFHLSTRSMTMHGNELGWLGYLERVLELGGFVGGGLIAPLLLSFRPHCASCNRYLRKKVLALVPNEGDVDAILRSRADAKRLREECEARGPSSRRKEFSELAEVFIVRLLRCPGCHDGAIVVEKMTGPPWERHGVLFKSESLDAKVVWELA